MFKKRGEPAAENAKKLKTIWGMCTEGWLLIGKMIIKTQKTYKLREILLLLKKKTNKNNNNNNRQEFLENQKNIKILGNPYKWA